MGPADVVLCFFGDARIINKIRIYKNVSRKISVLEELAKVINVIAAKPANHDN